MFVRLVIYDYYAHIVYGKRKRKKTFLTGTSVNNPRFVSMASLPHLFLLIDKLNTRKFFKIRCRNLS